VSEAIQARIFDGGWAARLARRLRLQGTVRTRVHEFNFSGASPSTPPLRVGFASDFHAGPLTHPSVLQRAFEALAAATPEVVLLGGDFISIRAEYIDSFCEHLQALKPPHGLFAVLGNHDLWVDDALIVERLREAGVCVLVNKNVRLGAPYEHVFICGLDEPWTGAPDPGKTFEQADGVRILLMHSPSGLLLLGGHRFELALAGHTHGGQVALPGGIPIVTGGGPVDRRYVHGRFRLSDGHGELIVSKGVGCTGLPIRLFAVSEVHICTINWRGADSD
jgi:predicted MPP superfamily phosphohydrolase